MCGFYIFSVLIPVFVGATWVPRSVKDSDSFPLVATKVSQYSQNHNKWGEKGQVFVGMVVNGGVTL